MRLIFHKKGIARVDLVDAKTKRPIYTLRTHAATFGTRAVLSRCSQNNDGDEGDDEVGETTIRDFVSDKITVGDVKRVAKKWLHQDGSKRTFTVSSGAQYTWSLAEEDYIGHKGSSDLEVARLHTDGTDAAKAYLDVDTPEEDQDEVLMSCIYLRLHETNLTSTAGGTALLDPISIAGPPSGGGTFGGHHTPL